jgi:hypothetical protein
MTEEENDYLAQTILCLFRKEKLRIMNWGQIKNDKCAKNSYVQEAAMWNEMKTEGYIDMNIINITKNKINKSRNSPIFNDQHYNQSSIIKLNLN